MQSLHRMLSRCPVCAGTLHITEVACGACGTRVAGAFENSRFSALTEDQLHFVELFLRSRGNLSSLGDELDISYPTVTRRLDAIVAALDQHASAAAVGAPSAPPAHGSLPTPPAAPPTDAHNGAHDRARLDVLEMLDRGEITAEEATKRLKEL